jgi:hypothetical protein
MVPILTYLIDECHLDVNSKDHDRKVSFLLEVLTDRQRMTRELAEFLLSRKADVMEMAGNKRTVLELASQMCRPEVKAVFAEWKENHKL